MTSSGRARLDAAVAIVQRDLDATGVGRRATVVALDADRLGAGFDDDLLASHDQPVSGDTAETAVWSVAEAIQDTLASVHWVVWPVCREHGLGMHVHPLGSVGIPDPDDDLPWPPPVPGWWCRGEGGHEVAAVGSLPWPDADAQAGRR